MTTSTARSAALTPPRPEITSTTRFRIERGQSSTSSAAPSIKYGNDSRSSSVISDEDVRQEEKDTWNYALLIVLYTLQGIPMGLSASIPFLIQQKIKDLVSAGVGGSLSSTGTGGVEAASIAPSSSAAALSYNANAIFALCSWPFSLKLLWAPIVDACFFPRFGRRKSWLVPVQSLAGALMVLGSRFVERQLGLHPRSSMTSSALFDATGESASDASTFQVRGVTAFFFVLYFLMATQDIAVDGWALTLLSPKNRGRGPVCNSIGQNIGYFISFVGFLALNDAESSERLWRPLFGLPSNPSRGLVSLESFLKFMGYFMLFTTMAVAVFKKEERPTHARSRSPFSAKRKADDDAELDASVIGLRETYHRLWAVCQLPAVQWLFVILLTYRLPTSLGDNVKFLKAVEYGLSKSTTALLSPTVILPLGILVPILATKVWHGHPLRQFMTAYKLRVTLVPLLDVLMLHALRRQRANGGGSSSSWWMWCLPLVVFSTAAQAIVQSMQFNSQMTFFAHRVDPAIGGSYMTLLNTAANLGGTWPASFVLWLLSRVSGKDCSEASSSSSSCRDPYFLVQALFSILGVLWIFVFGRRVQHISQLPDDSWRTHLLPEYENDDNNIASVHSKNDYSAADRHIKKNHNLTSVDVELGGAPTYATSETQSPGDPSLRQVRQPEQLL